MRRSEDIRNAASMLPEERWGPVARPLKILILKPSSLGDVIQALPVLRLLKRHLPQSSIYWWIETGFAPLLEADPDLNGLIHFERHRWARPQNWAALWRGVRWMRAQAFDWVIDLQGLARSAVAGWLANGELFIGPDSMREGARGFYDIQVPRPSFLTHAVDWYLAVLSRLAVPTQGEFEWLPPRADIAAEIRRRWPVGTGRWLAVQAGARWLNKRWPVEHFVELLRRLAAARPELNFAILGGHEDRALGERIGSVDPKRCLDLTGRTTLPEMVEWIRLAELTLTNDTGPMHVAAALRRPVVALFGPTEPRRTGPYGQLDHVLQLDLPCVPCLRSHCAYAKPLECLRALTPGAVLDAVLKRLPTEPP
jgi:heptosyltransferase I